MDFLNYFKQNIISRGYNYYLEGRVLSTSSDRIWISSEVEGSNETYFVRLNLSKDFIDKDLFIDIVKYRMDNYDIKVTYLVSLLSISKTYFLNASRVISRMLSASSSVARRTCI